MINSFVYSASVLPASVFGDQAPVFEAELAGEPAPHLRDGGLVDRVSCAYDLARTPVG